jgi:hypothetical protein
MHYIIKYCSISLTYVITTLQDTLTRVNTRQLTGLGQLQFVYKKTTASNF